MNSDHNYHLIAFSEKGQRLMGILKESDILKSILPDEHPMFTCYDGTLIRELGGIKALSGKIFEAHKIKPQVMIFICATGIAVRAISPFVNDKLTDPPVIVIDDYGRFVISLLSGHLGEANALTRYFSNALMKLSFEGIPVITTATDVRGVAGVEPLLQHFHVEISSVRHDIKKLNMAIANGHRVGVYIDPIIREAEDKEGFPFSTYLFKFESLDDFQKFDGLKICISIQPLENILGFKWQSESSLYGYYSRSVVLGTGCRKGVATEDYERLLRKALSQEKIAEQSIKYFASINLKANERCILETSKKFESSCKFFEPHQLAKIDILFEGSDFVKKTTGVSAVAGPSAYLLTQDPMTLKIIKGDACTFSFGRIKL